MLFAVSAPPNVKLTTGPPGFFKKNPQPMFAQEVTQRPMFAQRATMAAAQGKIAMVEDAAKARLAADKSEFNKSIREMRRVGILPPGVKPKAKHFNMLSAYRNSQAAQLRASSITRDLAAFESMGGMGAQIVATLNNPKAKATERAIALQAMIQITKAAPMVVSAARIEPDDESPFLIDDSELDAVMEEFGGD